MTPATTAYEQIINTIAHLYDAGERAAIAKNILESILQQRPYPKHAVLSTIQEQQLQHYLQQLQTGKPLQYVLGTAWFYGLELGVNEYTLIPRPETEQLAHLLVETIKNEPAQVVLDIGTGSGCIPIALSFHLKKGTYYGVDISVEALKQASLNATKYITPVHWIQADFLDEQSWDQLPQPDILVSNPPYIPLLERDTLDLHVKNYEPALALFTPDDDPLIFYKKIADFAQQRMKKGAQLYLELHTPLAEPTFAIFRNRSFSNVTLVKDWFGLDRFIIAVT